MISRKKKSVIEKVEVIEKRKTSSSTYLPVHVHTDFSIGDAILSVEEYVDWAIENKIKAICLTDHGSLCGSLIFNQKCLKAGIKPIIGIEAYCMFENDFKDKLRKREHCIILAKSLKGYHNLLHVFGKAIREHFYYRPVVLYEDLFEYKEDLIISSACMAGRIPQMILKGDEKRAIEFVNIMKDKFGDDFYLEAIETQMKEQRIVNDWIFDNYKSLGVKGIWTTDTHYRNKEHIAGHDAVLMINRKFTYMDHDYKEKLYTARNLWLKSREEIIQEVTESKYDVSIVNEFLDNTLEIADKTEEYKLSTTETIMPHFAKNSYEVLEKQVWSELEKRGWDKRKGYPERVKLELEVIKGKKMEDYFLIVQDIVKYAEANGIFSGAGRGCFVPESNVLLENNIKKPIKNIEKDDLIISGFGNKRKVLEKYEYEVDEDLYKIELKNNEKIDGCTNDHEILAISKNKEKKIENAVWKKAREIKIGDCLIKDYDNNIKDKGSGTCRQYKIKKNCPKKVINLVESFGIKGEILITKNFYKKYKEFIPYTKKLIIVGKCDKSKVKTRNTFLQIQNRNLESLKEKLLCKFCIAKSIGIDKDWKKKNSETQKIVQNKPEVKRKNILSVKRAWANKERRKKWIKSIIKANNRKETREKNRKASIKNWKNEEYREKVLSSIRSFSGISGTFYSKYSGNIIFESSYELCFLFLKDLEKKKIKRCKFSLPYRLDNKNRYYKLDFIDVSDLIEIKCCRTSHYQTNTELKEKNKVARRYCKKHGLNFRLITGEELQKVFNEKNMNFVYKLIYVLRRHKIVKLFKERNQNFSDSNEKVQRFEELINKWNLLK